MNWLKKQNPTFKTSSEKSSLEYYKDWESKNKETLAEYEKLVVPLWNGKGQDFTSYLASKSHTLVKKNKGTERKKKENNRKDFNKCSLDQTIIVIDDSDDDDVVFVDERPSKKRKT